MYRFFEQDENVINVSLIKNRFEIIRTMLTLMGTQDDTIYLAIQFHIRCQVDGVAMGLPLGPRLANVFLCHHEKNWLNDCPNNFKPVFNKRYVDDIFVLLKKSEHVQLYQQ